MKKLSFILIILTLVSCKSISTVQEFRRSDVQERDSKSSDVQEFRSVDTVYRHDSIILRERTVHDTVYITKEVYRDRREAKGERQKAVKTDTVRLTEYVTQTEYRDRVVQKPPERYVPCFYKWCAGLLAGVGIILIIIITLKVRKRILIKRSSSVSN